MDDMNNAFLGMGWCFPLQTESGQIQMVDHEEAVRQSIWMILSTAPGERVMRPDFGCDIHGMVFGLNSATTLGQIKNEVQRALVLWEPRIDLITVTVDVDTREQSKILVQVDYRIRTTNSRFNLVYPFYLESLE